MTGSEVRFLSAAPFPFPVLLGVSPGNKDAAGMAEVAPSPPHGMLKAMSKTPPSPPKQDAKQAKQERLEKALRDNLRRRKQAAGRKGAANNG